MGKAMRWEPAHERLLERILAAGEEEIRARWRRALRTQFPKCWSLKQLVEHWDAYAADAPGRPKDVRRGHLRAEDMRHDEPIGEVKL